MKKILSVLFLAMVSMVGAFGSSSDKVIPPQGNTVPRSFDAQVESRDKLLLIQKVLSSDLNDLIKNLKKEGKLSSNDFTWRIGVDSEIKKHFEYGAPIPEATDRIAEKIKKDVLPLSKDEKNFKTVISAFRNILYRIKKAAVEDHSRDGDYLLDGDKFVHGFLVGNGRCPDYAIHLWNNKDELKSASKGIISMKFFEQDSFVEGDEFFNKVLKTPYLDYTLGESNLASLEEDELKNRKVEALGAISSDMARFLAVSLILWYHNDPKADLTQLVMGK